MKQIQFTSGCPNNCTYCYEPKEMKFYDPEIPEDKEFQILDMNFLANPNLFWIFEKIPKGKQIELICGIDYRRLNQTIANKLKEKGFIKIRWAWDYEYNDINQKIHQKIWRILKKAGFRSEELSIFVLVNWKISYNDCLKKLDLFKVWNVKINDCCYDGGYKLAIPNTWTKDQLKDFRKKCRKHNQLVRFKIDPELK